MSTYDKLWLREKLWKIGTVFGQQCCAVQIFVFPGYLVLTRTLQIHHIVQYVSHCVLTNTMITIDCRCLLLGLQNLTDLLRPIRFHSFTYFFVLLRISLADSMCSWLVLLPSCLNAVVYFFVNNTMMISRCLFGTSTGTGLRVIVCPCGCWKIWERYPLILQLFLLYVGIRLLLIAVGWLHAVGRSKSFTIPVLFQTETFRAQNIGMQPYATHWNVRIGF